MIIGTCVCLVCMQSYCIKYSQQLHPYWDPNSKYPRYLSNTLVWLVNPVYIIVNYLTFRSETIDLRGCFVGISEDVEHAVMFRILSEVVSFSNLNADALLHHIFMHTCFLQLILWLSRHVYTYGEEYFFVHFFSPTE